MGKAVVLLSGGLDSTTLLAIARSEGQEIYSLTFDYGQRHKVEIDQAKKSADLYEVKKHLVMKLDLRGMGGSALTADVEVPKDREEEEMAGEIPVTYVPARNTIFLSLALGWAEVLEASRLYIGVNAIDYSGYPDCRPEFIEAFEKMASLATKAGVEGKKLSIHTPLISLTKGEIIKKGTSLGVDYSRTLSCYDPLLGGKPCRRCDSCRLRAKGFKEAGLEDPLLKIF